MKPLNIKAGQPIKFIGKIDSKPMIITAGNHKANPEPKFIILKGTKL